MNFIKAIRDYFWNKDFWLPENYDWDEIMIYNQCNLTNLILIPLTIALILYLIRIFFEKLIARPIGKYIGLDDNEHDLKSNGILEAYYKKDQTITHGMCEHLSRETGLKPDQIRQWFKSRNNQNKSSSTLNKFTESGWRFFFYTFIWIFGLWVLYDKPWTWNVSDCWLNYPRHKITNDVYWYYMIELGFYLSLFVTQFYDIKRKDFWQMFLHHLVTISLIIFSYVCNFIRLGTLVLVIHDLSDCWLEISKMASYANCKKICNVTFSIFTLTWFLARLIAYPVIILRSTMIDAQKLMGPFPAYYLFNILLFLLQIMHIIWFYMICRIAFKAFNEGDFVDERSEPDESETNNIELKKKLK